MLIRSLPKHPAYMKHFLFLFTITLLSLTAFTLRNENTSMLSGTVSDSSGEILIGAIIKVTNDTGLVKGGITDFEGKYRIELQPGTYDVEFSYTGYETQRIVDVVVEAGKATVLNTILNSGAVLDEVVITAFKIPMIEQDATSSGVVLTGREIHPASSGAPAGRRSKKMRSAAPKSAVAEERDMSIRGSRSEPTSYYVDGIRVASEPPPPPPAPEPAMLKGDDMEMAPMHFKELPAEAAESPGIPGQPDPRAGLLTAGEWNDLHNWNTHWTDLLKDGETDEYQKTYGFYPKQHYTVLLSNEDNFPLVDVPVTLYDRFGKAVWEARTDNTGKAELWANLFTGKYEKDMFVAAAQINGRSETLGLLKPAEEGLNHKQFQVDCQHPQTLDIVWTVDATGSMGDELEYLKTELYDVISRVKYANPELGVRMGSVFYRDVDDAYIVKSSALNHDIGKTVEYIREQSAAGGGDYPEAVHSALEEAILKQPWSREAVARICFLVLDASPHQTPEVNASLQNSIREAAKKGIRIVPVSASGIQKDTEFLMKFFGLATNGTYVFLTDHSGIGGKHLEPTTDEYKVEPFNDLLVRLITEYTAMPTCDGKSSIRFADQDNSQNQQQQQNQEPVLYYPNPASTQFTLQLPFDADKVTLYDAEGKAVRNLTTLSAGTHRVQVNDLSEGFYTLRIWKGRTVQSGKVLVVRA
ncbi:MAG: T9SS type A sorting domain-containing protein [Bacteroidetes bacterium]|nr:MAG: T9SS type A sorting domain-containing protein [Bacteroidota bacterium]